MSDPGEDLLARLSLAIGALQAIEGDSRTPIESALALTEQLRRLTEARRALRAAAFTLAADDPALVAALAQLTEVSRALGDDLDAMKRHADFVKQAKAAADTVASIAKAVGALLG